MKKILSFLISCLLLSNAMAHVFEIRANQAPNGSITWYLISYHDAAECPANTAGLTVNGVNYPITSVVAGDARPLAPILVSYDPNCYQTVNPGFPLPANLYVSYAIVNTPFLLPPLSVVPFSTTNCFAFCVGGTGNFIPPPTISFTATTTSGSVGSTSNGSPTNVSIDFCSGASFTFSGYGSVPSTRVGAVEKLESSGNVTTSAIPIPLNRPQTIIPPSAMASHFSSTFLNYALASGTYGQIDQHFTPFFDLNSNNAYDAGIDVIGNTVNLIYKIYSKPVITCPGNQAANTAQGLCSAIVNYNVGFNSTLPANLTHTFSGATVGAGGGSGSGSSFNKGVTTVTVTATNSCGSSSCSFDVVVTDAQNPAITCPADIVQTNDPGLCSANVTVSPPGLSDNCNVICNTDDIDEYSPGPINGQSPQWAPWLVQPSGVVTTEKFLSAPNSMKISGPAAYGPTTPDQLFLLGNQTGGVWKLTFQMYVSGGHTAQYNLQKHEVPTIQWGHQVEFYSNGTGKLFAGPTTNFVYPQNQWFEVKQLINQVTNQSSLYINGVLLSTWAFSNNSGGGAGINQVGALDFFAQTSAFAPDPNPAATSLFYVDDITLCGDPVRMGNYIARRYSKKYPVGTTPVTIKITDETGNPGSCMFRVTVNDNEDPKITCPADVNHTADAGVCSYSFTPSSATATDNCPGVTVAGVRSDGNGLNDPYPVGTTTIKWTASDAHGHSVSCVQTIKVTDDEDPKITCPADVNHTADAGVCSYSFIPTPAGATDNCPGVSVNGVRSDGQLLGDPYPVGTTTIKWTATDAHGHSVSCDQVVKVTDDENPVIACPANIAQTADAGKCSYSFTPSPATATDNCPGVSVNGVRSDSKPLSDPYPVGTTIIKWTATDAHGHSVSCDQTVKVTDNEKPKAICKNVTVTLANGAVSITAADVNNNSTDNCGILSVTASPLSFNCGNIGNNPVTLTVTDIHGNVQTCTATVTVVGEIPKCSITSTPSNNTYTGGVPTTLYLGYGPASTTLNPNASGGASFNYSWSGPAGLSCYSCATPIFTATAVGTFTYTVLVTNNYGCTTTCKITITVVDVRCGNKNDKVLVCQVPPGDPANAHTICISPNAVATHLANGSYLGNCTNGNRTAKPEVIVTTTDGMNVYPNPNNGLFDVQLTGVKPSKATIVILNGNGSILEKRAIEINSKKQLLSFDMSRYASGLYYIQLITPDGIKSDKVTVQR
jgi:plastocyanin